MEKYNYIHSSVKNKLIAAGVSEKRAEQTANYCVHSFKVGRFKTGGDINKYIEKEVKRMERLKARLRSDPIQKAP